MGEPDPQGRSALIRDLLQPAPRGITPASCRLAAHRAAHSDRAKSEETRVSTAVAGSRATIELRNAIQTALLGSRRLSIAEQGPPLRHRGVAESVAAGVRRGATREEMAPCCTMTVADRQPLLGLLAWLEFDDGTDQA